MKKNIVMVIALFAACMQGMETNESIFLTITFGGTKINLNKGNVVNCLQNNKNNMLKIGVPKVRINNFFDVSYERSKPKFERYQATILSQCCYYTDSVNEVIGEALKDLRLCYEESLTKAVQEKKKSVVLSALNIGSYKSHFKNNNDLENKAAQCTISTIIEFIRDNPELLDDINVFVEEDCECNLYQTLLTTFKIAPRTKNIYWEK
jgi:hypothetical protein